MYAYSLLCDSVSIIQLSLTWKGPHTLHVYYFIKYNIYTKKLICITYNKKYYVCIMLIPYVVFNNSIKYTLCFCLLCVVAKRTHM